METIPACPTCGNTKKGDRAKKCQCGKITCQKCSFTGCKFCGSMSRVKEYVIG